MGKQFITDEVNPSYVVKVTSGGRLRNEDGASSFWRCPTAHTLISANKIVDGGCFLKSVIIGEAQSAAGALCIYDTYASASNVSGFDTTGANVVAVIGFEPSAGALSGMQESYPRVLPINVYLTTGLSVGVSVSAGTDLKGRVGGIRGITLTYNA